MAGDYGKNPGFPAQGDTGSTCWLCESDQATSLSRLSSPREGKVLKRTLSLLHYLGTGSQSQPGGRQKAFQLWLAGKMAGVPGLPEYQGGNALKRSCPSWDRSSTPVIHQGFHSGRTGGSLPASCCMCFLLSFSPYLSISSPIPFMSLLELQ